MRARIHPCLREGSSSWCGTELWCFKQVACGQTPVVFFLVFFFTHKRSKRSRTSSTLNVPPVKWKYQDLPDTRTKDSQVWPETRISNRRENREENGVYMLFFFFFFNSFTHPPLPLTPLCISGCSQSGMMARGPWINPQPDVYAAPVCLNGSPPLIAAFVPPPPSPSPATSLSLLMGTL